MQQGIEQKDQLILTERKNLIMNGVDTVDGFSEQSLKLTVKGAKVYINGENIKITAYNKANGNLNADGNFYEIKYNVKKKPLIKRIFK